MCRHETTIVAVLLCSACGTGTPVGTYMGKIDGSDAWLAISVSSSRAVAFVCGGPTTLTSHTRWLATTIDKDVSSMETDGWRLDVFVNDEWVSGDLTSPDGVGQGFQIDVVPGSSPESSSRATDDGITGLYAAMDSGCRAGVIVRGTADSFETAGAWCDSEGAVAPLSPALPLAVTELGLQVRADTQGGTRVFFAPEVEPGEL